MARPLRILLFSTLYPSRVRPQHGIFVATRLRELLKTGEVEAKVVAPVPWFPSSNPRFGDYALSAATPRYETLEGVEVHHPRFLLPPKVGMQIAPRTLAWGALPTLRKLQREGFDFDLIDAHYYYPDGVAAMHLARALGKPFVVTARGSDVNLVGNFEAPRRRMLAAAQAASSTITVSRALRERLITMGADGSKIHVLSNGVDLQRFAPHANDAERASDRASLGLAGPTLLSVGNLVELKGHDLTLKALAQLPGCTLLIAGHGALRAMLESLAATLGVKDRVRFLGGVPQAELPRYYACADALVLSSSREGMANVLLESLACGTPAVATRVGGNAEVVADPVAGEVVERTPEAIAAGVRAVMARGSSRSAVREYAQRFDWAETSRGQLKIFCEALAQSSSKSRYE